MSTSLKIPNHAWVLVADAGKALLLVNEGDEVYPNLRVSRTVEAPANPRTSGQGSDRPGRSIFAGRRSAVGQTDWHQAAEDSFAATVGAILSEGSHPSALVLVAPPRFLARLRERLPDWAKTALLAEIAKDYTHLTVGEIEQSLTG